MSPPKRHKKVKISPALEAVFRKFERDRRRSYHKDYPFRRLPMDLVKYILSFMDQPFKRRYIPSRFAKIKGGTAKKLERMTRGLK